MVFVGLTSLALDVSCGSATTGNNSSSANKPTSNASSSTANAAAPASARTAEFKMTAEALAKEYKADSNSKEKYKDKIVEISGKFSRSAGSVDVPEVKFETGDTGVDVTCRLSPSAFQAAAKFQKGQDIKLTGKGNPVTIIGPIFNDCEIAQ